MASQRRAPTKRPPRPAAKKPSPPLGPSEGQDPAEGARGAAAGSASGPATKAGGTGVVESATANGDRDDAQTAGPSTATPAETPPKANPTPTKTRTTTAAKNGTTAAKGAPAAGRPRPSPSGPTYRPPTGAPRTASRRPPPPRRKQSRINKKTIGAVIGLVVIVSVVIFFAFAVNGSNNGVTGLAATDNTPEQVPIPSGPVLAAPNATQYGQPIDGIQCNTSEQLKYHIHAHLTIFVNGQAQVIPYGIGIAQPLQTEQIKDGTFVASGACFYWLHTHSDDGIIHIESPTSSIYTLGQFFDEWGQPLNSGQVGPALGKLTVYQNGKLYTGNPRNVQLTAHNQIQLDVGSPAPAQTLITFPSGL